MAGGRSRATDTRKIYKRSTFLRRDYVRSVSGWGVVPEHFKGPEHTEIDAFETFFCFY